MSRDEGNGTPAIATAYQVEIERLAEQLTIAEAHACALASALKALITYVRLTGGYMPSSDQAVLRWAERILAEYEARR